MSRPTTSNEPITDAELAPWAEGAASTFQKLAGHANRLYQLITGGGMDGYAPTIAPNPQGLIGIDYSGPPYGSARKHTIASWVSGELGVSSFGPRYTELGVPLLFEPRVWVRPFHVHEGAPYSRAFVSVAAFLSDPGTMDFKIVLTSEDGTKSETTFTTTDTGVLVFHADTGNASGFLKASPGWNNWKISIVPLTSGNSLGVEGCSIAQLAKRSHT